jgi:ATP-dependent DNA helicase RecQ
LTEVPRPIEDLRTAAKLTDEEFDKALEKLEIHGGARVDYAGNVTIGTPGWKKTYSIQAQHRAEQFSKVLRFTESSECRMSALVRHFGDDEDAAQPCGKCDVCDPASAVLRMFRRVTHAERAIAEAILDELRSADYKAAGTLQKNIDPSGNVTRDDFDAVLDALARAHLISIEEAEYEKDGQVRRYRKISATDPGRCRPASQVDLLISDGIAEEFATLTAHKASRKKPKQTQISQQTAPMSLSAEGEAIAARLKEWRTGEAKRLRVPSYCVLHDRTLTAVALARPVNPRQLLEIDGIGPGKAEKFGPAILEICGAKPIADH